MERKKNYWLGFVLIILGISFLYFNYQVESIYGGDAGDLVSAIVVSGIPHPPGYPLYTIGGIILTKIISLGTIAWRVGFLSSLPAIMTLLLLYDLLFYLTKRFLVSLISVLILAFTYPFWLYSEVVEVFSLNNLFTVLLLWFAFHWSNERKVKYLYLASFAFGLALSHHHIILFLAPVLIYQIFKKRNKSFQRSVPLFLLLFFLGLLPYTYVLISAHFNPPLNWQGPPTVNNFFQLVTRAGYGTFRAAGNIAYEPILRLVNVWAFFNFFLKDFRILGLILFLLGVVYLVRFNRQILISLLFGLFSYLFFIFYASFPLTENFIVGTFERFVQPLYIFITFFIAFGLVQIQDFFKEIFAFRKVKYPLFQLTVSLFFIYPLGLFILNYPKISILKRDFTAENLGRDILNSVPEGSILIISTDTPLFNSQYVYYIEKKWPKVKLIHLAKLYTHYYFGQLKKHYPDLILPDQTGSQKDLFASFLNKNYPKFPIYSKLPFQTDGGVWIPYGLLFRYYKKEDIPSDSQVLAENGRFWSSYHDPLAGSLSLYQNLMLSDILRYYAFAHQEIGFWAAKHGFTKEAERHLLEAERLYPDDFDSYIILAQVYILDKRCQEAQEQIGQVIKKDPSQASSYYLQVINYATCFKDNEKASYYQKLYEEKSKGRQTPLKKL